MFSNKELKQSNFNCKSKFVTLNSLQKRTGTLDGNVCMVKGAQVESQSEDYSYTCVFEINGQTLQQKVSTDFIGNDQPLRRLSCGKQSVKIELS